MAGTVQFSEKFGLTKYEENIMTQLILVIATFIMLIMGPHLIMLMMTVMMILVPIKK